MLRKGLMFSAPRFLLLSNPARALRFLLLSGLDQALRFLLLSKGPPELSAARTAQGS
jgi:hypothetical protein